jgi:hypothetical protein
MESIISSFLPMIFIQAIYAAFVFQVAKRTGKSVRVYVVITLVPIIGGFFFLYVMWSTFLDLLDSVNRLERKSMPQPPRL